MKNNDLSAATVGTKLWNPRLGWGTVTAISTGGAYPITVRWTNKTITFTTDGRSYVDANTLPSLFWDEVTFDYPSKPLQKLAVDTLINVQINNVPCPRYFSHFDANGDLHTFNNGRTSITGTGHTTNWPDGTWELYTPPAKEETEGTLHIFIITDTTTE